MCVIPFDIRATWIQNLIKSYQILFDLYSIFVLGVNFSKTADQVRTGIWSTSRPNGGDLDKQAEQANFTKISYVYFIILKSQKIIQ